MVEFSLSLPPANRATGDVIPASDHNNLTEAVDDLRQQAQTAVTDLETGKADTGHDHTGQYSEPGHTHPIGDLQTSGLADGTKFLRGDATWSVPPSGGGVTDHGGLTGLADDDHPQYHTNTRGDARYYTKAQVDNLLGGYYTKAEVDAIVNDIYAAMGTDPPPPSDDRSGLVAGTYRPDATNTGVPDNVALTTYNDTELVINESYITANGGRGPDGRFVFERFDFPDGRLRVFAPDVTVREGRVRVASGTSTVEAVKWTNTGSTGGLIEDVTISVANGLPVDAGVLGNENLTISRCNISGAVDGIKAYNNVDVTGCWVHDLQKFDPDPFGIHSDGTHNDAIQFEGLGVCRAIGNDLYAPNNGTAAIMATQNTGAFTELVIDRNWGTGGGAATFNIAEKGLGAIPLTFTNNTVYEGASRDVICDAATWNAATVSGNVRGDGGTLDVWLNQ